jgi:hypothetical protein
VQEADAEQRQPVQRERREDAERAASCSVRSWRSSPRVRADLDAMRKRGAERVAH